MFLAKESQAYELKKTLPPSGSALAGVVRSRNLESVITLGNRLSQHVNRL